MKISTKSDWGDGRAPPSFCQLESIPQLEMLIQSLDPEKPQINICFSLVDRLANGTTIPFPKDIKKSSLYPHFIDTITFQSPHVFVSLWIQVTNLLFFEEHIEKHFITVQFLERFICFVRLLDIPLLQDFAQLFSHFMKHKEVHHVLREAFKDLSFHLLLLEELNSRPHIQALFSIAKDLVDLYFENDDVQHFQCFTPILIFSLQNPNVQFYAAKALTRLVFNLDNVEYLKTTALCDTITKIFTTPNMIEKQATVSDLFVILNELMDEDSLYTDDFFRALAANLGNWDNSDVQPLFYFITEVFPDYKKKCLNYGILDAVVHIAKGGYNHQKQNALDALCQICENFHPKTEFSLMSGVFGLIIDLLQFVSSERSPAYLNFIGQVLDQCPTLYIPIAIDHNYDGVLEELLQSEGPESIKIQACLNQFDLIRD